MSFVGRVVVLGQAQDSRGVLEQLKTTSAITTHLEEIGDLDAELAEHGPDLALVVGSDFQEEEVRLQIQRTVGTRPCLLIYIDANYGVEQSIAHDGEPEAS